MSSKSKISRDVEKLRKYLGYRFGTSTGKTKGDERHFLNKIGIDTQEIQGYI
jgi:hypothetical protein